MGLVDKLFGNKSEKEIKRIEKYVDAIEALDEKMQAWVVLFCTRDVSLR